MGTDWVLATTLPTWPCSCCFIHISFCYFFIYLCSCLCKDEEGYTCLHEAVDYVYPGMLRALMRRGARVNTQNNTVNIICVKSRALVLMFVVLCGWQGYTALHRAAADGMHQCLGILLDAGADKSILDEVLEWLLLHSHPVMVVLWCCMCWCRMVKLPKLWRGIMTSQHRLHWSRYPRNQDAKIIIILQT